MLLFTLACVASEKEPAAPINNGTEFAVVGTVALDYSVGSLASASLDGIVNDDISTISGDSALFFEAGYLWQLNRYQYDTIRKYDPTSLVAPLAEVSVAPEEGSSNPHDVAVCSDKLFVSLYEQPYMLVLDINSLVEVGRIDISDYADSDQRTEASSLVVHQEKLFLGLEGLDRNANFSAVGSTILEINCATETISDSWKNGSNIKIFSSLTENELLITTEAWEDQAGGIYSFDTQNGNWEPIVTLEEDNVSTLATIENQIVYISAAPDYSSYKVNCFNQTDGTIFTSDPFIEYLTQIAVNSSGEAWVSAHWGWVDINNANPGVYRFDVQRCQEIDLHLLFNLAPVNITFVQLD
jgi:hypothetical protein